MSYDKLSKEELLEKIVEYNLTGEDYIEDFIDELSRRASYKDKEFLIKFTKTVTEERCGKRDRLSDLIKKLR